MADPAPLSFKTRGGGGGGGLGGVAYKDRARPPPHGAQGESATELPQGVWKVHDGNGKVPDGGWEAPGVRVNREKQCPNANTCSPKDQIKHVVRVSCMGAGTLTASSDKDEHVLRPGAEIPLMLHHYWWGEEALIKEGLPVTVLRANIFMNHLLKTDLQNIGQRTG